MRVRLSNPSLHQPLPLNIGIASLAEINACIYISADSDLYLVMLLLVMATLPVVSAKTITVKQDGSGGYTTIGTAMAAAVAGDIVEVQDSNIYTEVG